MASNEPLRRILRVQALLERDLAEVLREAARDTFRLLLRFKVGARAARLAEIMRDVRRIQHDLWVSGVGESIGSRLRDAEKAAEASARALDEFLVRTVGERRADILRDSFSRQVERGLRIEASRIPQELSVRVYRNADLSSGRIERVIRAAIIRGQSARELAQQVRSMIDPRVRGGVSHAAMRLGRTELNNAFHQHQITQAQRDWVTGVKWNLSKSHPKPDRCDLYAAHDEGLGRGVWDKNAVPPKPHPQCMCYMTYELMSPDEALDLIVAAAS